MPPIPKSEHIKLQHLQVEACQQASLLAEHLAAPMSSFGKDGTLLKPSGETQPTRITYTSRGMKWNEDVMALTPHIVQRDHALVLACAACAAFTPIHVFSTRPSSFCMSELQSFITSSALRLLRKFTMPAGRSIRAHTVPATTSRQSVSSAC